MVVSISQAATAVVTVIKGGAKAAQGGANIAGSASVRTVGSVASLALLSLPHLQVPPSLLEELRKRVAWVVGKGFCLFADQTLRAPLWFGNDVFHAVCKELGIKIGPTQGGGRPSGFRPPGM